MSRALPKSLDELYQLEKHLEGGFRDMLKKTTSGYNWDLSRGAVVSSAPRGEIKVKVGPNVNHGHVIDAEKNIFVWDGWQAELDTTLITDRTDDKEKADHLKLIGITRARLQMFYIVPIWTKYQNAVLLTDIREQGTTDSFVDKDNLDFTTIKWLLFFNINPLAWAPAILNQ